MFFSPLQRRNAFPYTPADGCLRAFGIFVLNNGPTAKPGHHNRPIAAANSSVLVGVGGSMKYAANITARRM
jgi:hypothetical protein